ncbi:RNA polymerase sigma-70 factor, ECF subfamily [Mucilaginibacter mallensis]|uniref:RNA polymerase sigma-70 factor, ECF subfamily n=1 Tax=Mucilaginibacter mallensis TaxID=652787 RepID=A0A1H2BZ79_MUCMA|nr:RNA polymerase sigma-70 factor [Mucilaginibacter mallensis]SDT63414.1 RNA polymerase sigma-70 factor, ECF subfamily [Mucilaginibacter mallensis]
MAALQISTDQKLVALLKQGQETAFTEIYSRYWKSLYSNANNVLGDDELAKDIVQNVFISIWQRRLELDIQSLKAYLHQAVRFAVFKVIREQKVNDAFYERLAYVTVEIINDNPLVYKEQQELINKLINSLPPDCLEAYQLSREENLTYKQIAFQLSISEKTVEKRLSKSLRHIRNGLSVGACVAVIMLVS